jgi:outer membrane biosynthesis protein TonB
MKLIHAILSAGAASLLPTALAQEPAAKPFAITFQSDATPIAHAEYRYTAWAGARGLQGSCEVSFAISTAGKADAIRVGSCSSDVFRRAAKTTVEGMTFAPRSVAKDGVSATISWSMTSGEMRTASLD